MPARPPGANITLGASTTRLSRDLRRASFLWRRHTRDVRRELDRARRDATRVAAGIGTALAAGITQSTKALVEFERGVNKITALVGVSAGQLAEWRGEIERIGQVSGQGPRELLDALFQITSAGLRGGQALDVLEASAKASAIGLGETGQIADLVTSAMNAYGAEVLSAQQATDGLIEAIRLGKLEPASLASAMGRALPIASAMGVSFQELAGIIAAMSRTGTTAEEAVTQIRSALLGILKPGAEAQSALRAVGISAEDLQRSTQEIGFTATILELREALGGTNQDLVRVFPNIRALAGLFDLLGPSIETNIDIIGQMADSTDVGAEAFAQLAGNASLALDSLKSRAEFVLVRIGEGLRRDLVDAAGQGQDAMDALAASADGIGRAFGSVIRGAVTVTALLVQNGRAILGAAKLYLAYRAALLAATVGQAVQAAVAGLIALARAFRTAGLAAGLATVLTGALPLAIGALTALIVSLREYWAGTIADIGRGFRQLGELATIGGKLFAAGFLDGLALIPRGVDAVLEGIEAAINAALRNVLAFVESTVNSVIDAINNTIGTITGELLSRVALAADPIEAIGGALDGVIGSLTGKADQLRLSALANARAAAALNAEIIDTPAGLESLPDAVLQRFEQVKGFITGAVDDLTSLSLELQGGDDAGGGVPDAGGAGNLALPSLEDFTDGVADAAEAQRTVGADALDAFRQGLRSAFREGDLSGIGKGILSTVAGSITDASADAISDAVGGLFKRAFSGLNGDQSLTDSLGALFSGLFRGAGSLLSGIGSIFGGIFHEGLRTGPVPGPRGATVPILAEAGEYVATLPQLRALAGGGGGDVIVQLSATGDVTAATERALLRSGRRIGDIAQQQMERRRAI